MGFLYIKNGGSLYMGKYGFLIQVAVMTVATVLASFIFPGVRFDSLWTAIVTGLVLSLLNNFIRPILIVITLPFTIFSMGLFLLIVNALIIEMAAALVPSLHVDSFLNALFFGLLITFINYLLELPNRGMRHPRFDDGSEPRQPDDAGRIIDTGSDDDDFQDCEEVE